MAKLAQMPNQGVIDGFRGVLDFYLWCNLVIVRAWPRSPGSNRSRPVTARANRFGYAASQVRAISPELQAAYANQAQGSPYTWKDFLHRYYTSGTTDFHASPE